MSAQAFWRTLGIEPTESEAAVRAAYAAKLKLTNPEDDAEGFKRLRAAYEAALWDARWRARRAKMAAPAPAEDQDEDQAHVDEDFEGTDERGPLGDAEPRLAPMPRPAPYVAPAEIDPELEAHRATCAHLEALLRANAPPEEINQAYKSVRASPAMGGINVYANTEAWLASLLHRTRPASEILVDRAIADFGWEQAGRRVRDDGAGASALRLRARIATEREQSDLILRLSDRRHEFNYAYRDITRPFAARNWLSRQKSLLRAGLMQRFIDYVAAKQPTFLETFDEEALTWWRKRLSRPRPPYWAWHAFVRVGFVFFAICAAIALNPVRPSSSESREAAEQVGPLNTQEARVAARAKCATGLRAVGWSGYSDCAEILRLAPDALLMRQYAGIAALHARDPSLSGEQFDAILALAPNDPYALYGKGYGLTLVNASRAEGREMMAQAVAARADVIDYFAAFGVAASFDPLPTGASPRAPPPPLLPRYDVPPKVQGALSFPAVAEAMRHFGMEGDMPTGTVRLQCLARIEGHLSDCVVLEESPPNQGLSELALSAVPTLPVSPATLNGIPVDRAPLRIPIRFRNDAP